MNSSVMKLFACADWFDQCKPIEFMYPLPFPFITTIHPNECAEFLF